MSEKIVQLNEEVIKGQIKKLVRGSVEETLNELLEKGGGAADTGRPLRAQRGPPRLPQRALRQKTHHNLRRRHAACAAAQGRILRDRHHRAVSPQGEQRGGSAH